MLERVLKMYRLKVFALSSFITQIAHNSHQLRFDIYIYFTLNFSVMNDVISLRAWAKANGFTRISHTVQEGKETHFPCIFATNPQTAESKVLMLSKGLGKEVEVGDPVRPLWDHPVTTSDDGTRLYLGRPQYDEIE